MIVSIPNSAPSLYPERYEKNDAAAIVPRNRIPHSNDIFILLDWVSII